jgi:hypothetical protein
MGPPRAVPCAHALKRRELQHQHQRSGCCGVCQGVGLSLQLTGPERRGVFFQQSFPPQLYHGTHHDREVNKYRPEFDDGLLLPSVFTFVVDVIRDENHRQR